MSRMLESYRNRLIDSTKKEDSNEATLEVKIKEFEKRMIPYERYHPQILELPPEDNGLKVLRFNNETKEDFREIERILQETFGKSSYKMEGRPMVSWCFIYPRNIPKDILKLFS